MHLKMLVSDEAIAQIKDFMMRKEYYISDKQKIFFSNNIDVLTAVFKTLT